VRQSGSANSWRARLGEPQMMSFRRPASAQQAGLRGYEQQVRTIAVVARFAQGEGAFVDTPSDGTAHLRAPRL
jgi:hypothetical protein